MGNYIAYFTSCLKCRNRFNTKKIDEGHLNDDDINLKTLTQNEFYCPECEGYESISEVLKIHSDNGKIELKCHKKDHEFNLSLKEYCDKVKERVEKKCHVCQNNKADALCLGCEENNNYYCATCGKTHIDKWKERKKKKMNIFIKFIQNLACIQWLINKCPDKDEHKLTFIKEITSTCSKHKLSTTECCMECGKNVCKECLEQFHKWHEKKFHFSWEGIKNMISCTSMHDNKILKARTIIYDKGQKLLKMKEFYDMIKSAYVAHSDKKIYKENLDKVSECIKNEKERSSEDTDLAIYRLEQIKNKIEYEKDEKGKPDNLIS